MTSGTESLSGTVLAEMRMGARTLMMIIYWMCQATLYIVHRRPYQYYGQGFSHFILVLVLFYTSVLVPFYHAKMLELTLLPSLCKYCGHESVIACIAPQMIINHVGLWSSG